MDRVARKGDLSFVEYVPEGRRRHVAGGRMGHHGRGAGLTAVGGTAPLQYDGAGDAMSRGSCSAAVAHTPHALRHE